MTSKIKVDNIADQGNNNLINKCGSTITLGANGDTIQLASGASQSGFGRSGSVDWQTTPKTATFTAADGEGYFINSGSAITANLPAGSPGAIVAFSDYARNFATYNFSISANGSEKIGGETNDAKLTVNGQAATFVYVDSTKGWVNVQNAEDTETGLIPFIGAVGGNSITTCGNFKIHTFTSPGTFTVCRTATCAADNVVEYLVVAGGASGAYFGGGGGAGGLRYYAKCLPAPAPATPINNNPSGTSITVTATDFPITVGAGGAANSPGGNPVGNPGSSSTFSTITSAGGGGGGAYTSPTGKAGLAGGSGGGGGNGEGGPGAGGGAGNTPPVSPSQGNSGGGAGNRCGGGYGSGGAGGGALAAGAGVPSTCGTGGGTAGGVGAGFTGGHFDSSNGQCSSCVQYFAGGGGGTSSTGPVGGSGGLGGGGQAAPNPSLPNNNLGVDGTDNTGGGGGGNRGAPSPSSSGGGAGGSGIVVIRYKFQ